MYKNIVLETFRKGFFKVFDETISKHLETGSKKRLPEVPKTLENKDKDWNEFFFGFIYDTYQSEQKLKKSIIEDLIAKTN